MRKKDTERFFKQKITKEQLLPVCLVLFFIAIGLSVVMTLGLQACSSGLESMIGGAA